jgi:hypothetical protein
MGYRVIQWGTGRVGKDAVRGIVGHQDLQLVGAWVHSEDKDGRDVGEICDLGPLGVVATRDKEALLEMPADCVCFATARTWAGDPMQIVSELERILRAGKNVANASWPALVHAPGIGGGVYERLQAACLEGGTTLYTGGIDPGFGSLGLALAALTVVGQVHSVRSFEILNYAHWANPEFIRAQLGFGGHEVGALFTSGQNIEIFGPMLHLMAEATGGHIDEVVQTYDVVYADETFDVPAGHIEAGTICGIRFEVRGMVEGVARFIVEHVTMLRDKDFPDLEFKGGGYRIDIEGIPNVRLDLNLSWPSAAAGSLLGGASGRPGLFATAMAVVNAIPQVCEAPPGVLSYLDMKPHPCKNLDTRRADGAPS